MTPTSMLHVLCGFLALLTGGAILFFPKGTRLHKAFGYTYVVSMVALNLSALFIYKVFHSFGPFHAFALVSLLSVLAGFWPVFRRKTGWLKSHYEWMGWSYCGLCAAAVAELGTHPPIQYPSALRAFFSFVAPAIVFLIGRQILVKNRARFLAVFAALKSA